MSTARPTIDSHLLWETIRSVHVIAFTDNKSRRTPITVLANQRTLNLLIGGDDQTHYFLFDKIILRTSLGDIYFRPHKSYDDGAFLVL